MQPMLAAPGRVVPEGDEWVHEVKWDGVRALVDVRGHAFRIDSRRGNNVTETYPELQLMLESLPHDVLLDGEIVSLVDGVPRFQSIAERMNITTAHRALAAAAVRPVTLLVFDVLRLDGLSLVDYPLTLRRELLEELELDGVHWQTPPQHDDGRALQRLTLERGLEGVVSKRRDSPYTPGARSEHWLKFPHRVTASYVIGGWRPETENPKRLGSVLVGVPRDGGLVFRGRVGSGLAGRAGEVLLEVLRTIETDESPFAAPVPREDAMGSRWVEPLLVVDVAALGLSSQLKLRAPSYQRMRPDLHADEVADDGL